MTTRWQSIMTAASKICFRLRGRWQSTARKAIATWHSRITPSPPPPSITNPSTGAANPNQQEIAEIRPEAPADILQLISVGTGGQNAEQNCEYTLNSSDVLRTDSTQIEPDTLFFQIQQPA